MYVGYITISITSRRHPTTLPRLHAVALDCILVHSWPAVDRSTACAAHISHVFLSTSHHLGSWRCNYLLFIRLSYCIFAFFTVPLTYSHFTLGNHIATLRLAKRNGSFGRCQLTAAQALWEEEKKNDKKTIKKRKKSNNESKRNILVGAVKWIYFLRGVFARRGQSRRRRRPFLFYFKLFIRINFSFIVPVRCS